ncbi:hypothetical protein MKW94_000063 [Papaver nudicaule]|uniref:Uncharacterized protein n=1 Tax=Papaver nudicaule TaxID=74823 RepID=A0AA42AR72_PAPNU|nr:hypothetical protein [Papaver nudicaule]
MTSQVQLIEKHRENAETYSEDEICQAKCLQLLDEISLPNGLLQLVDITEVGYNRTSGFVWLRQKKKREHFYKDIGKPVTYDKVTAFMEKHRIKKLTGVKSKDFSIIWVTVCEIYIDDPSNGKITFNKSYL